MLQHELRKSTWRGMTVFLAVLAAIVVAPAWSLQYWQGWLYWAVFVACTVPSTIYFLRHDPKLVERRLSAGPAAESRTRQKVIQTFTSLFMALTFAFPGLDHQFGWSSVPPTIAVGADALVVVGFLIMIRALKENGYAASTIRIEQDQPVVSSGPYAIVRHPMYAGGLVMMLATPIALGSVWGLVFAVLTVGALVWRLLDEEEFLSANLPGYAGYRRTMRYRLVPYLW